MNMMAEAKKRREAKQAELEKLNYTFSPAVDFSGLSIDELTDLSNLQVGESTYIIDSGDVSRTA